MGAGSVASLAADTTFNKSAFLQVDACYVTAGAIVDPGVIFPVILVAR